MDSDIALLGGFAIFVYVFLFVLAVLWFVLPFAIFGIKPKLAQIINEMKKTNAELAFISNELVAARIEREQCAQDLEDTKADLEPIHRDDVTTDATRAVGFMEAKDIAAMVRRGDRP